jgi:type I restriction enzyme S subunit
MGKWPVTKVSTFLFEREGKYKPNAKEVANFKRIEKIDFKGNFYIANKPSNTNMILVKSGDLVMSGINVAKGAMGIYEGEEVVTATIHYSSYTFDEQKINVEYFKRFLKSPEFIKLLQEQVKGGIKTEIKPKHILSLQIPLPSLPQQEEILFKFQRMETEDRELKLQISYQQSLLKQLKQEILQDAIEGKLTEKWRIANPDIEPAIKLLKRITDEKEQLIKSGKIKKQKPLTKITEGDKPFALPKNWEWCRLDQIIYESPRNGYSPKSVDFQTNTKTLKLGATTKGTFDASEYKYINEEIDQYSYLWLKEKDILIQRSNSLDHVGISAIYQGKEHTFIYPDLMMKIQVVDRIDYIFVHKILTSPFCREYFRTNATGAQKSMPKINQGTVSCAMIPLPPLEEQKEIVDNINELFAICDQLEAKITRNQAYADQLMLAVLKEAFTQTAETKQTNSNVVEFNSKNVQEYKSY